MAFGFKDLCILKGNRKCISFPITCSVCLTAPPSSSLSPLKLLLEKHCESVDWIQLPQSRVKLWVLVYIVVKLRAP
jgi:hypothetical protein